MNETPQPPQNPADNPQDALPAKFNERGEIITEGVLEQPINQAAERNLQLESQELADTDGFDINDPNIDPALKTQLLVDQEASRIAAEARAKLRARFLGKD
jgi:hypothetical protein